MLIGLAVFGALAIYAAMHNNLVLAFAGIALGGGIILLALYIVFKALERKWWS